MWMTKWSGIVCMDSRKVSHVWPTWSPIMMKLLGWMREMQWVLPILTSGRFSTLISHNILIGKVRKCGLSELTVSWIENWLSSKSQKVIISGTNTNWMPVTSRVQYCSILGPGFFNLFINYLDEGADAFSANSLTTHSWCPGGMPWVH